MYGLSLGHNMPSHPQTGNITMKVISGIVSRVRNTAEISGNRHGVGTSQILGFRIGRQAVELTMASLPPIEDGDDVAVAGDVVNGVLIARAFRNFSNNSHGQWKHGWCFPCVVTLLFVLPVPLMMLYALMNGHSVMQSLGCMIYVVPFSPFPFMAIARSLAAIKTSLAMKRIWSVKD